MFSVVVSIYFLHVDTGLVETVVEPNTTVGDLVLERGSIRVERGVELGGEFVERDLGLVGELVELGDVMALFLGLRFGGCGRTHEASLLRTHMSTISKTSSLVIGLMT